MVENDLKKEGEIRPLDFSLGSFVLLYIGIAWLTLLPATVLGYLYFHFQPFSFELIPLLLLIPLFFLLFGVTLLSSYIVSKTGFWVVHKRITPPIPGSYPFTMKDPNTRAYIIKGNIKPFGRWIFRLLNLQFLKAIWLRCCGVQLGKNVRIADYIHDEDLITIGNNVFFAKTCQVSGHLINQWGLTLNKTIIGNNIIMKRFSGSVGGIVGDKSIFEPVTGAMKGQVCKGNAIYRGIPCKKIRDNDLSSMDIETLKREIEEFDSIDFITRKNAAIKISAFKMTFMKITVIIGAFLFAMLFLYIFYLLVRGLYAPTNILSTILLILLIPFGTYISMGFFAFGTAIFVKIFLIYYNRKAEIPEGYYELDDPKAKIFKIKYMLRIFGLKLIRKTPLSIADTFAMSFWGNVSLGKNIVIQDAIVDPQYIEFGDNVVIGGGARIHTHAFVDGKLYIKKVKIAQNVMVGAIAHVEPGFEVAEGSLIAVLAQVERDQKSDKPVLWMGQPASQFPIELITQTAGFQEKKVDD